MVARVIDAFRAHGGRLELDSHRGILAGQVGSLAAKGVPEILLVAAASQLGRDRAFVGDLTKLVRQYEAEGLPCAWRGGRQGLTLEQLQECGCAGCLQRVEDLRALTLA